MIFVNEAYKVDTVYKPYAEGIIKMLSCITPHIGEEMWQLLGHEESIAYAPWPTYDESKLEVSKVMIVVQVNGKVRDRFEADKDADKEAVEKQALALDTIQKYLAEGEVRKVIVIPNKIVNIVVK